MSYRIDLLLPSERRSAVGISFRFLVFAGAGSALALILLGAAWLMITAHISKARLAEVKTHEAQVSKKYQDITRLQKETAKIKPLADFAEQWRKARPPLGEILNVLQDLPASTMQLTRLMLEEPSESYAKEGARNFTLSLQGIVTGPAPEAEVQKLNSALRSVPPFKELVESSRITRYAALEDKAGRADKMVFEIICRFKPVRFASKAPVKAAKKK